MHLVIFPCLPLFPLPTHPRFPPHEGDTPPELKGPKYRVDLEWNPYEDKEFMFYDRNLVNSCLEHEPVSTGGGQLPWCGVVW